SSMTCCRYPSESECSAWDAWTNPVAEANDPSSLVSEYAACGVWRPHTVLPFSRMSLVAYLRGWVRGYCQRSDITLARTADVLRLAAAQVAGWDEGSVWEMVGRNAQARELAAEALCGRDGGVSFAPQMLREKCFAVCDWQVVFRRGCSLTASESSAAGGSQRSVGTLAGIVDVLGVAAPHGPAVVWYVTRRVNARMAERLLVVCRNAVCLGDGRAYSSGGGGKRRNGLAAVFCVSRQLPHHVASRLLLMG
ncbi:hypothetical protein TGGT1_411520, partial [Toxoplasma gondii GT1]